MFENIKKIITSHQSLQQKKNLRIANNDLLISARRGSRSGVMAALENGADINFSNTTNALFSAITSENLDCLKLVLDKNVNLNFKADADLSAFQMALASSVKVEILNCLLDYPFNHNAQDIDGNTNAHYASDNIELLEKIVAKGGRLDIKNKEGRNPFNHQFLSRNVVNRKKVCEFYVEHNCDIFENNLNGQSPFLLGVMCGKVDKEKEVIDYFCSLIDNPQYLEKALHQLKQLQESENKKYAIRQINAIGLSLDLEKQLIVKSGKDRKLKI